MSNQIEVTKHEVTLDREKIKPGTPVADLPMGCQASLRMANQTHFVDAPDSEESGDDQTGKTKPVKAGKSNVVVKDETKLEETEVANSTDDQIDPDDQVAIDQFGIADGVVKLLRKNNIDTLGDARKHFEEHGHFETIKGIAGEKSDDVVEALALGVGGDDESDEEVEETEEDSEV